MADEERDDEAQITDALRLPRTPQQEPDIHNFSTSSSHRLVTISGTQALQNELRRARGITTSLPGLDASLVPTGSTISASGIRRSYVTEIYGPPGVGKTTFGMQLATNALHSSDPNSKVVWLNTGSPLVHSRLASVLTSYTLPSTTDPPSSPPELQPLDTLLSRFQYHEITSLPHLLTLVIHPTSLFPSPFTNLLIIDDLSNLIFSSLPHHPQSTNKSDPLATALSKRESTRRIQIVESLSSSLSSLAASRHIAIVILNKCTTAQKPGSQAMLKSALAGQAWDLGVNTRIVLYRDYPPSDVGDALIDEERRSYRVAEVTRLGNKDVVRNGVPFVIRAEGVREIVLGKDDELGSMIHESEGKKNAEEIDADAPPMSAFTPMMMLSDLPPIDDATESDGNEQLVDRGEPEVENLGPGMEEEDAPQFSTPADASIVPAKRKAIEIADSEDEDDADGEPGDDDLDNEPELPRILSAREMRDEENEEEMLV